MVLYSQYGGFMKNTGKRLKKYTALALALSIVSPMAAFASEQEPTDSEIILTETKLETIPYKKSVTMTSSEDGKKISYDIDIKKDENASGNLTAYIYQLGQSNIENLSLEGQSIDEELGKAIKVDLKEKSTLKITADIKEGKTENLSFDLVLVDDKDYKDHTHIDAKLVKKADKFEVEEVKSDSKNLGLSGIFTDSETITWTDNLVNNTDELVKTDYILNVSSNQDLAMQKLTLDFYQLSSEGYKLKESNSYDLGSIKDLEIAPHSLVKLSFTTKALPSDEVYQINDAIVTNNKTNRQALLETDKTKEDQAKDLTEDLIDTSKEIQTTLVANEKNQDTDITRKTDEKLEEKLGEVKTITVDDNKAKTKEVQAQELTQQINSISGQISQILQENEAQLPETIMNRSKSEEKPESSKELTAIELTNKLEKIKGEIEQTLKLVITADQYNKLITTNTEPTKEEEAQSLIKTLNNQTSQILEILRQVELGQEANYLDEHPEELAKIDKLLEDVEKFDENTKKTVKENQEKNKDYVSPHFVIVKEDFSKEVYKKLENVVTVTLDPLERTQTTMTKEEIKNEYPSIAHYLENLELRSDLLNSLK